MPLNVGGVPVVDLNVGGTQIAEAWIDGIKLWPTNEDDVNIIITAIGTHVDAQIGDQHGFGSNDPGGHGTFAPEDVTFPDGTQCASLSMVTATPIDYAAIPPFNFGLSADNPLTAMNGPWVLWTSQMLPDAPPLVFMPEDFGSIVRLSATATFPNLWIKENVVNYRNDRFTAGSWEDGEPMELLLPAVPQPVGDPRVLTGIKCNSVRQIVSPTPPSGGTVTDLNLIADGNENTHMIYLPNFNDPASSRLHIGVKFPITVGPNDLIKSVAMRVKCAKSGNGPDMPFRTQNDSVSLQNYNLIRPIWDVNNPTIIEHTMSGEGGLMGGGELIYPWWANGAEVILEMGDGSTGANGQWEIYYVEMDVTIQEYDGFDSPIMRSPVTHASITISAVGWNFPEDAVDGTTATSIYQWTGANPTGTYVMGWNPLFPAGTEILGYELYVGATFQNNVAFNAGWTLGGAGLIGFERVSAPLNNGNVNWDSPQNALTNANYDNLIGNSPEILAAWNALEFTGVFGPMAQAGDSIRLMGARVEVTYITPGGSVERKTLRRTVFPESRLNAPDGAAVVIE